MGVLETAILYATLGVAVAIFTAHTSTARGFERYGTLLAAFAFWPLFTPSLIAGERPRSTARPENAVAARIHREEERLVAALSALEGVAAEVLSPEVRRVRSLFRGLDKMSVRLAELEALLATPDYSGDPPRKAAEKLAILRDRTKDQIDRTLLEVEELVSQLHLIRFANSPDDEIVRRVRDLAAGIEGLAEGLLAE